MEESNTCSTSSTLDLRKPHRSMLFPFPRHTQIVTQMPKLHSWTDTNKLLPKLLPIYNFYTNHSPHCSTFAHNVIGNANNALWRTTSK